MNRRPYLNDRLGGLGGNVPSARRKASRSTLEIGVRVVAGFLMIVAGIALVYLGLSLIANA